MYKKKEQYLKNIYYNTKKPGSFSGINKLLHHVKKDGKFKFTEDEIHKWLQAQEIHTTNRLVHRQKKRRRVITPYIDYMWDVDTASFINYAKQNNNYGYFILAIDTMSRFIWTKAIKTPTKWETKKAFENFFTDKRIPHKIRSDKGSEFSNKIMKQFFEEHNIHHFVTQNEVKANFAERGIQTIKGKLMKYMRAKQTHRWVDELDNITKTYNNTIHRSIKQTPASVSKKDEIKLWKLLYSSKKPFTPPKRFKFNIKDFVRISKLREQFQRFYSEHWTNEVFIIKERTIKQNIPSYTLTDYDGEMIKGIFYESELQKVYIDKNTKYKVEKVLRNRTEKGRRESLVRWMGWPEKFDAWIPTKNITDYK